MTGLLLTSPILFLGLHGPAMKAVGGIAIVGASGVLLWRSITVLWRFRL